MSAHTSQTPHSASARGRQVLEEALGGSPACCVEVGRNRYVSVETVEGYEALTRLARGDRQARECLDLVVVDEPTGGYRYTQPSWEQFVMIGDPQFHGDQYALTDEEQAVEDYYEALSDAYASDDFSAFNQAYPTPQDIPPEPDTTTWQHGHPEHHWLPDTQ